MVILYVKLGTNVGLRTGRMKTSILNSWPVLFAVHMAVIVYGNDNRRINFRVSAFPAMRRFLVVPY